ncbi:alpha/beta hydrolase [Myroides indicus]|uniref:Pimeloyl-ACP methyl ester carboxylesterase n=1 Tax=Myroides indicus TaxID=1323422 RepID=A0A4R7F1W7_9FLAO|nr:alpha/beta hydrolase [Myroides indicus]TDS64299.1 hypothetical protein C8P70_10415 [Myroides indicus]
MNKIPVYFMPGMCSTSSIFERIVLDHNLFELHYLEWLPVDSNESMEQYAQKLSLLITQPNPILIGVSFGGIIAQELSQIITVQKTIIISSIRSAQELCPLFKFLKKTKLYKLLPTGQINNIFKLYLKFSSPKRAKRLALYDKYLSLRNKKYINWCVREILNWKRNQPLQGVIHIQGSKDIVFPLKFSTPDIVIKGGTHAMILVRYKWFNKHLQDLILK